MRLKSGRLTPTRDLSGGETRGSAPDKSGEFQVHANAGTCYSSLKLSDLVGYLDATDRVPVRAAEAAHADIAAVEVEEVGAIVAKPGRPIAAVVASTAGIAVIVAAAAGSREKDLRSIVKISVIATEITTLLTSYCHER